MAQKKTKKTTKEQADRKELIDYFSKVCSGEINYPILQKTINKIMSDDYVQYTYKGLEYALWYAVVKKNMSITSISIACYLYEEAKNYYQWQQRMKQQVAGWMPTDEDAVIVRRDKEEDVFT